MFSFRIIIYFLFLKRIKVKHRAQASIGVVLIYEALNIFEHLVYLLYPFILEFLAQIIFSFIFPDTFIIQMDQEKILNIIFTIINAILIILYNIHNYFFMKIINNPYGDKDSEIKYRYSSHKFWIIFLVQNVSIIQNIQLYFKTDEQVKLFSYIYSIFFFLLFIILFIMSVQSFNYKNGANTFISMMTIFCYVSIIIKFICSIFGYSFNTTGSIVALTIFKILVVLYFNHVIESFNEKYLLTTGIKELFKINKDISNNKIYDCFIYIQEILKSIKNNNSNSSKSRLLNHIFKHQNKCSLSNCKCKLIQIIPHGTEYDKNFSENLLERISFLIESSFIQIDFSDNCELSLILSGHYFHIRDNPIMAYSFIQTLLIFNLDNLSLSQIISCYELCQNILKQ